MSKIILIDARMYGLENSGIGRYLINLIEELKNLKTGTEFTVLLRRKYFNVLNLPENWKKVLADFRHYSFAEQLLLPLILKKENPDLVHFPHFNVPIVSTKPFVVTIHDMIMHFQTTNATTLPFYKYIFKRLPFKYVFRYALDRSEKILTPSRTVRTEIVNYFKVDPKKIVVTYEGFNTHYIIGKRSLSELEILTKFGLFNKDYFFYVGNAYPHKNLEKVIQATVDLNKNKNKSVSFVIAGSRDIFMDRLQKIVDKNNAQEFVKIIGFVLEDELRVIYKNSLGFIFASFSEGFGLQGLEAIASGTILLASNIPVFREIYENHAFYFNPKDTASISETMYSVLNMGRQDRYKYLAAAQKFIKRYSWQKMAKETLEIYRQVLDKS